MYIPSNFCVDQKENDGWYPAETLVKVKKIMRAKLSALREGRLPSDDEFASLLLDNNISVTPPPEESFLPAGEIVDGDSVYDDDEQLEGENVDDENLMGDQVDHLMTNLMEQSREHLSIFPRNNLF